MCGIFAVSGNHKNSGKVVLEGLKELEYRGYDSWGIAVRNEATKIETQKDIGKISEVCCDFVPGNEALGHTRWATHGGVTPKNAHPHKVGRVTLVHNGIFENYLEVKRDFPHQRFESETDSEVIAFLLDNLLKTKKDPLKALQALSEKIKGRFSIVVMIEGISGIFALRRGSPLIIGKGISETFIASDIPAFLEKTNVVNYLDDDEIVHFESDNIIFYTLKNLEKIQKRDVEVPWKKEKSSKENFPHFMIKEIYEQKNTLGLATSHKSEALAPFIEALRQNKNIYFIGCGTAHKVCMTAKYFFAEIPKRNIQVVEASEMPSFEPFVNEQTTIVAVSQSGETADILEILERSKKRGAKILSVTNVVSSSIARISEVHLAIHAGQEKAVASTKASTSQMALLLLCAYADSCGVFNFEEKLNLGREILSLTASNINDMLNPRYQEHVENIAQKIVERDTLFIIGRASLFPMALESAIKIQEVSYIHAQGFAAGELKHGPIALIEKGTPCIVLGDDAETVSNAVELKSRGAMIIGTSHRHCEVFDEWIRVPDCGTAQAIASIIPIQILAYHLAVLRGHDPDMPRNLAKSVTVK